MKALKLKNDEAPPPAESRDRDHLEDKSRVNDETDCCDDSRRVAASLQLKSSTDTHRPAEPPPPPPPPPPAALQSTPAQGRTVPRKMAEEDKDPTPVVESLSDGQLRSHNKMEPKTLGAIQIVIGALILCLSVSVLQIHEVHYTGDVYLFLVVVLQVTFSGSVLIHSGRRPSLFWVKFALVLHLISAAFSTAALGLLSKHLPYRQNSYHCEHCRRLEQHAVQHCFRKCTGLIELKCKLLIDGILATLVIFLVLELLICITAMLFGLSVLAAQGRQTPTSKPAYPQSRPPPAPVVSAAPGPAGPLVPAGPAGPLVPASPAGPTGPTVATVLVAQAAAEPSQVEVFVTEPDSERAEDVTPPTEPQVEPMEGVSSEP